MEALWKQEVSQQTQVTLRFAQNRRSQDWCALADEINVKHSSRGPSALASVSADMPSGGLPVLWRLRPDSDGLGSNDPSPARASPEASDEYAENGLACLAEKCSNTLVRYNGVVRQFEITN